MELRLKVVVTELEISPEEVFYSNMLIAGAVNSKKP